MVTRLERQLDQATENLYRVAEFRKWVQTNVLFPTVPDSIVNPLLEQLRETEHRLMKVLYDNNALERIAAIQKTLTKT